MTAQRLLLTEEQRDLINAVRDVARSMDFRRNSIKYMDGTYPEANLKALAKIGVLGMSIPEEYGGTNLRVFENTAFPVDVARNQIVFEALNWEADYLFFCDCDHQFEPDTVARLLARAINCGNRGDSAEPCNDCPSCRQGVSGSSLDIIEMDGASNNGVDEVRALIEAAQYRPSKGRFKVYIIDEVHQLSRPAFNALLKILEEPPSHVKFIMATTEVHKLPETVLSRCQRYDFRRLSGHHDG